MSQLSKVSLFLIVNEAGTNWNRPRLFISPLCSIETAKTSSVPKIEEIVLEKGTVGELEAVVSCFCN